MNYIVTTIIMQLHLVVMYRLLFLGVALLTQTNGTTSHTHRSYIKSIYWKTVNNIKHRTRQESFLPHTQHTSPYWKIYSSQPFISDLQWRYNGEVKPFLRAGCLIFLNFAIIMTSLIHHSRKR